MHVDTTWKFQEMYRLRDIASKDAGLIVLSAFISPFCSERDMVRHMMASGEFIEVYIDTPISVAGERDVKGLYAKARSGELKNFTGVDSPYEAPDSPEIHIKTTDVSVDEAAEQIIAYLFRDNSA